MCHFKQVKSVRDNMFFKKINDVLKTYRIVNWYYYLGLTIIGFILSNPLGIGITKYILLSSFLLSYAYSLNDFYDERKKEKIFILPLILAFLTLPLFNTVQIIFSILFITIVTLYSAEPFRLKSKPIICSLLNGFGFTILFILSYSFQNSIEVGVLFALLFFSLNMVAQFIHETVDMKEDRKNKIITTAILYGKKKMKKLCYLFLWFTFLISVYFLYLKIVDLLFVLTTFSFVIFFTVKIKDKIDKKLRRNYRIMGMIVGLIYLFLLI